MTLGAAFFTRALTMSSSLPGILMIGARLISDGSICINPSGLGADLNNCRAFPNLRHSHFMA